ncbi:uncharacterized protein LOC144553582 isoform X2 [Carex rostrata]
MGSGNSRMRTGPPRRRKPSHAACFLCGGASAAAAAAADDDSDLTDTQTLGNKNSDRNQSASATHLGKSPAKEFENSHSEMVSNQASTSTGTNPSSDLQTGELFSTDFSSEISELHSSPSSNLASTGTVINAESEGLSPSSTDSGPSNHDINNVRRSIWESFSRRSYGRSNDSSDGDLGIYDRLLDLGDGLYGDSIGDELRSSHLRQYGSSGLNWHSRSRMRDRRRAGFHERHRNVSPVCPTGLHPDGMCVCRAFSSAEASISRIVMLTEALFEVLDEIHRHPAGLSISSAQAPESVVNSLPSKNYTKNVIRYNDDVEQCYICLTEYEEGDKIRVLPCNHEFHMACVDKWLKEVHRVCPLCRGNVCQNAL